jgi:hypothetical protein
MSNIRAIIIDPFKQEVREVEDDFNNFRVIGEYLRWGGSGLGNDRNEGYPLTMGPRIDSIHHMYLDDEGLFRANQSYFELSGYPQALAGYGIILALGINGEEQSCTLSVDFIKSLVRWQPSETEARLTVPPVTVTSFGPNGEESTSYFPVKFNDGVEATMGPVVDATMPKK